jgi:hypothetical protein
MLNCLKNKLVMAFTANNIINKDITKEPSNSTPSIDFSKTEIETLLVMIKESHFKGEHVQKVYELILKLQNYYSQLP